MGHLFPGWSGDPQGHGYSWAARALRPRPWGSGQCQVACGLPSGRPPPSSPGQGSSQDLDGFPDGARVWGPAGLLDAPAWPLPLEKGLWQPWGRGGQPWRCWRGPWLPHSTRMPRSSCRALAPLSGIGLSLTPHLVPVARGLLDTGLQLGPWSALTHCPSLGVLMPQCALLAPAAPTMAAEGTPPEASVPLPCSVWLPQPLPFLHRGGPGRRLPSPAEAVSGGPTPPVPRARPGAECGYCVLVSGGRLWAEGPMCAESGLPAPGRQVWPARGPVSSQCGIWTHRLLGALPITRQGCLVAFQRALA